MFRNTTRSTALILGAAVLLGLATKVESQPPNDAMPSLQALKTVDYTRAANDEQKAAVGYSTLREFVDACEAYSRGLSILPGFREPVQTRGDIGISVYKRVSPSVVLVLTANFKNDKVSDAGLGTGVIIDSAGYVLTNWHVVNGYDAAIIFFKPAVGTEPDTNSSYGVRVVALDEQADLALLKIIKPPSSLTAVKFGEFSSIQVAEDIHIIGHPQGNLWSYSTGVISQIRDQYDWNYTDGSKHLARVLQMQTAINPGNSGGPVLDNNSNMLGLVAMSEEGQNLNYAVAIDVIRVFVNSSLASRSRGMDTHTETEKGEIYSGHTKDGLSITKTVYSNLVSYTVRDAKGLPIGLLAETKDGAVLTALKPNAFGGFEQWDYKPFQGKTVVVRSSGVSPDVISTEK